jgi:type II secretory pathway component PulJ
VLKKRSTLVAAAKQRGLSIVELMIGIAIGLFIVAGASVLVSAQLGDNRRLLLETQLQQDLRAAADIMTREVRRAGGWGQSHHGIWMPDLTNQSNPNSTISSDAASVNFKYLRRQGQEGPYGFKLESGVMKTLMADAGWQELTDSRSIRINTLTVTPVNAPEIVLPCPSLCPGGGTACWPRVGVREFIVDIGANSTTDPAITRSLRTTVRLRNDLVRFNIAADPNQVCPL